MSYLFILTGDIRKITGSVDILYFQSPAGDSLTGNIVPISVFRYFLFISSCYWFFRVRRISFLPLFALAK